MEEQSQRSYKRGTHFNCVAKVSTDGIRWHHARVADLSSGGLNLASTVEYNVGDTLWFDLIISGFLSEFEVKTKGSVRSKKRFADDNIYGIQFIGLSQGLRVRIDESVHGDRPVLRGTYEE